MAKKTKDDSDNSQNGDEGGESVQGYFRRILNENPKLLKERSNEVLYNRWLADHPGYTEVPQRIKQNLSNLKSVLRKRIKRRKGTQQEDAAGSSSAPVAAKLAPGRRASNLMQLESMIDEALVQARQIDPVGLDEIIKLLRTARNRVIVRMEM